MKGIQSAAVVFIQKVLVLMFLVLMTGNIPMSAAEFCTEYGHYCHAPYKCCADVCCADRTAAGDTHQSSDFTGAFYSWNMWNMWYFWFVVLFVLSTCFGGCGYWRKRQIMFGGRHYHDNDLHHRGLPISYPALFASPAELNRANANTAGAFTNRGMTPEITTTAGVFANRDLSNSGIPSPPPYSEVYTKPENYKDMEKDMPPPYMTVALPPAYSEAPPTVDTMNQQSDEVTAASDTLSADTDTTRLVEPPAPPSGRDTNES
ncbi:uncharacterized protein LOC141911701 [Tubulanus polymorphus]|uniref:uncharacterized protein LOC141911701 n=1 Tax=Tubulanus polymorphus TaxID=672921 RepID=UPI003DA53040